MAGHCRLKQDPFSGVGWRFLFEGLQALRLEGTLDSIANDIALRVLRLDESCSGHLNDQGFGGRVA